MASLLQRLDIRVRIIGLVVLTVSAMGVTGAWTWLETTRISVLAAQLEDASGATTVAEQKGRPAPTGSSDTGDLAGSVKQIREHTAALRTTTLVVTAASAAILMVFGLWIGRTVASKINRNIKLFQEMAGGDLTQHVPLAYANCSQVMGCNKTDCASYGKTENCWSRVGSMQLFKEKIQCPAVLSGKVTDCSNCKVFHMAERDELDVLANWMNVCIDKIRFMVQEVSSSSGELAGEAEQLAAGAMQMAGNNESVVGQIQAVATGSEEMSATVQDVSRNTAEVSTAAEQAKAAATEGGAVISKAVEAMGEIAAVVEQAAATVKDLGQQSESIGTVVQVIEDIADQTNLLALNAAIEAARAGEHGRGFAVVADEVRKLAEKTVKATQEIDQTIAAIQSGSRGAVEAIDQGVQTVISSRELGEKAGEAIRDIESQVGLASDQTTRIATAIEQMAVTIREMAGNMEAIVSSAEDSNASTQEIISTVQHVARRAEKLKSIPGMFKT